MSGYTIGISGLQVAQQAIELIGNNLANAGTEGYHRQELSISPVQVDSASGEVAMSGPRVTGVRRLMDSLLENEIVRQQPLLGQIEQELLALQTMENSLGEVTSEGLTAALGSFFNSLSELTADPNSRALQEQTLWAADGLVAQFRNLSSFLTDLGEHVYLEAEALVENVNQLTNEIAKLNEEIHALSFSGSSANQLKDRRDQAIKELAELVDVQVQRGLAVEGVINVTAWGTPLVAGSHAANLEAGHVDGGNLGISVKDANYFMTGLSGGKLAGLMAVKNEILPDIQGRLDLLAQVIADRLNELHVQGVGPAGSFSTLTGVTVSQGTLDGWEPNVQAGSFYVRLMDPAGQATIHEVLVDPTADTVTSIRDKINLLDPAHLQAEVTNSALRLDALGGWRFDFVPAMMLDATGLSGAAPAQPAVTGIYSGQSSETFTCTVVGTGRVGVTDGLAVEVRNSGGQLVNTLNVGLGYAAGDVLTVGYGIDLAMTSGELNDGETFTIRAPASSDETGFLAAAGMNTFFAGRSAATIAVRDDIKDRPDRLATARGGEGTDNENIRRMAVIGSDKLTELGDISMIDFNRRTVLQVAQGVSFRKARQESVDKVLQQLVNQRDEISSVDINEEAARLLVFERMFQAMSRFIGAQDEALDTLMNVL